jgi:two-component system CheB/CheR fusion protein
MDANPTNDTAKLLRLLLDQEEDHALILWNDQAVITDWLMGAPLVFGYTAEEAIGQPASILYTPEDVAAGNYEFEIEVARKRGHSENDRWMRRKDGVCFWATGILKHLRHADGSPAGFGKVLRNRTDLRGQLDSLENRIRDLIATDRQKNAFLAKLSHELRNPLGAISHVADLFRIAPNSIATSPSAIESLSRQVDTMRRLIDDLLDVSRIANGKIQLRRERLSLAEIVGQALELCQNQTRSKGQPVQLLRPETELWIEGDAVRSRQVFVNLIENASKYTPETGRIWIKVMAENDEGVVRVEDSGIGISPEMLPRIFDLFTQAQSGIDSSQGGLGIGLSVVKELVELHRGSIQVRSDGLGKGSEFTVRLPLDGEATPSAHAV